MVKVKNYSYLAVSLVCQALLFLSFAILHIESLSAKPSTKKLLNTANSKIPHLPHGNLSLRNSTTSLQKVVKPYFSLFFQCANQEIIYAIAIKSMFHRMMTTKKTATSSFHSTQRVTYLRQ